MPSQPQALQRYRLVARLGSGGMAEVYLAVARGPSDYKKLVVLKVLRPDIAAQEQPGFLQMFLDEGQLAGRLNHPHIIHSYEPGVDAGQHFIAMEYLEGQALNVLQSRWWQGHDAHTVALELFVIAQVLDGLEYAHNLTDYDGTPLNIVHRDVSPQNVFVTYSGHSKLLDFGIAKTLESSKTQGGIVKGKVAYMAPEQVRTRALDRRADLFSVGVMLWECVAGRRMHRDASVFEILKRVGEGDLPKLRDAAPSVSPQLEAMVSRALAFDPAERYPDALSFREALLGLPELQGISARDVAVKLDQLFSKERADLNRLIHEAMSGAEELNLPASSTSRADPASTRTQDAPGDHAISNHAQANTLPIIAHTVASSSPATTATTAASIVPAPTTVHAWRKSAWLAGAAALVVLVGIAGLAATRRSSSQLAEAGAQTSGSAAQTAINPASARPNATGLSATDSTAASSNPASLGATNSHAASRGAAEESTVANAPRSAEAVAPRPTDAERTAPASSKAVKATATVAAQRPKASTPSAGKTNPGAPAPTEGNAASRAQPQKRDWVVPFPKLDRPKSSTDGARP